MQRLPSHRIQRAHELDEVDLQEQPATAGLRPGDLIVAVDGQPVEGMTDLQRLMVAERIGAPVVFTIARSSHVLEATVLPAELEAN